MVLVVGGDRRRGDHSDGHCGDYVMLIEYQCPFPGCRATTEAEKGESVFCDRHPPAQVVMRPVFHVPNTRYEVKGGKGFRQSYFE